MDIERVLRGTPATVTVTFYGGEEPQDADGTVTVTIKRSDGSTYSTGPATHEGDIGSGQYSVTISAQTTLDQFELEWSGDFGGSTATLTSYVEIVGGFYFTVSELRKYDQALTNATRFPVEKLVEKRLDVESEFEEICGRAFVPRFHREHLMNYSGEDYLRTEKPEVYKILKLTVDGQDRTSWEAGKLLVRDQDDPHIIHLYDEALELAWSDDVVIEYEYGLKKTPRLIKQAGLKRARGLLLGQNATIDERATVMSIPDFGTFNLATPGPQYTGIPDIDAILHRHMIGSGGVAGVF